MRRLWLAGLAAAALVAAAVFWPRDSPPTLRRTASDLVASGVPGVIVRVARRRRGARAREGRGVRGRYASASAASRRRSLPRLTLRLVDAALLSLDDTAAERSSLASSAMRDEITMRELLSPPAGLFDYTSDPALLRGELSTAALVGDRETAKPT